MPQHNFFLSSVLCMRDVGAKFYNIITCTVMKTHLVHCLYVYIRLWTISCEFLPLSCAVYIVVKKTSVSDTQPQNYTHRTPAGNGNAQLLLPGWLRHICMYQHRTAGLVPAPAPGHASAWWPQLHSLEDGHLCTKWSLSTQRWNEDINTGRS